MYAGDFKKHMVKPEMQDKVDVFAVRQDGKELFVPDDRMIPKKAKKILLRPKKER